MDTQTKFDILRDMIYHMGWSKREMNEDVEYSEEEKKEIKERNEYVDNAISTFIKAMVKEM